MRPRGYDRRGGIMQVAAAVVGSAAAAQVIAPADRERQTDENSYGTDVLPGTYETPHRLDVVGKNQRRLIAFRGSEGVWIGGCLVSDPEDLERLCAWLTTAGEAVSADHQARLAEEA